MKALRRKERALDESTNHALLTNALYGILASIDTDGQPHATPLNFAYAKEGDTHVLYFHSATEGQKLDNIDHNPRAVFTVVGATTLLAKEFTTNYQSVMAFGAVSRIEDIEEKRTAFRCLCHKYSPEYPEEAEKYIQTLEHKTVALRLVIDHLSGKHRHS